MAIQQEEGRDRAVAVEQQVGRMAMEKEPALNASKLVNLREGRPSVHLEWNDICFSVKDAKGEKKEILQNLSGKAAPGSLTAIMGASGAGKTSLLNVLASRISDGRANCSVSGSTKLNGAEVKPVDYAKRVAYVMQDDALLATATVREALTFSAKLRLPASVSVDQKLEHVEQMIEMLGLSDCADTMIGNELIKGVSGGERKRTAIGIELITSPDIIFLDEPTSGLDSYAAYNVVQLLQQLARSGCTVLSTIHQPSSEVFFLFDNITLLLGGGRLIYDADTAGLTAYLAENGFPCPENYNPADHVMFMMQTKGKQLNDLVTAWTVRAKDASLESGAAKQQDQGTGTSTSGGQAGFCEQLLILATRELQKTLRDKETMGARMGMTIGLGVITGGIFWQTGDQNKATYDLQSHFGALFQTSIGAMFGNAQPLILTFPIERPVFMREYATGSYGAAAYFFSKILVETPITAVQSCVLTFITYMMVGLHGSFLALWGAFFMLGMVSAGTAILIGSAVANIKTAMEAAPAVFVPQMLFAGFYIKMEQIPIFLRWIQYLCGLKWAMNIALVTEFAGDRCIELFRPTCHALVEANDSNEDDWFVYILVLCGAFAFFRLAALGALVNKAKYFY